MYGHVSYDYTVLGLYLPYRTLGQETPPFQSTDVCKYSWSQGYCTTNSFLTRIASGSPSRTCMTIQYRASISFKERRAKKLNRFEVLLYVNIPDHKDYKSRAITSGTSWFIMPPLTSHVFLITRITNPGQSRPGRVGSPCLLSHLTYTSHVPNLSRSIYI